MSQDAIGQSGDGQGNTPIRSPGVVGVGSLDEAHSSRSSSSGSSGHTEILKALDFHNKIVEGFSVFDLCRAKVGDEECATYMPLFYWRQAPGPRWKFQGAIQWDVVEQKMPQAYAFMC